MIREKIEETRKYIDRNNENTIGKFIKLINLLVFLSLARQKVENSEENKKKIKNEIRNLIEQIKENYLKIGILQGILRKLVNKDHFVSNKSDDPTFSLQILYENEVNFI